MFKIGDRVKRIEDDYQEMFPGDIGTVIAVDIFGDIAIEEFGGSGKFHSAYKFELVKEKPKKIIKKFGIAVFMESLNKK